MKVEPHHIEKAIKYGLTAVLVGVLVFIMSGYPFW
jgi:hypothetical protein